MWIFLSIAIDLSSETRSSRKQHLWSASASGSTLKTANTVSESGIKPSSIQPIVKSRASSTKLKAACSCSKLTCLRVLQIKCLICINSDDSDTLRYLHPVYSLCTFLLFIWYSQCFKHFKIFLNILAKIKKRERS